MALQAGSRIGPYQVAGQIGAGGMGEVYRAVDTNLGRHVAIKVLPDTFASDSDRLARFEREAKTLAALNHPNIAQIYGLEKTDGVRALVMELVEGPTLADRIAQGPIPVDEALAVAKQIAEALEAAHEQNIIHRDLKPANVKVRPDGTVKVLDFGLAKALESMSAPVDATASPTITSPAMMTGVGVLLGTAAYMSPEQARGKPVDKRTDIWAFGCVLYEMLTGKRGFGGEELTDTLAFIITKEPDWAALPPETPAAVQKLLRRCLEKERRRRMADAADARIEIEDALAVATGRDASSSALGTSDTERRRIADTAVAEARGALMRSMRRRMALLGVGVAALAALAGVAVWMATRPPPPRVTRLTVTAPVAALPSIDGSTRDLAVTPDGSRVVYAGANGTQLFVRSLDTLEASSVFKGAIRGPFVSPDAQWVGFVDGVTALKKVAITGGPAVTIAQLDGAARGATWLPDDTIIFATSGTTGLQRISAAGGTPSVLTHADRTRGEFDHLWPESLPGGRGVLFTITPTGGDLDAAQVAVLDLETGTQKVVVRSGSHAHYLASGHLMYAAVGSLWTVAFDVDRLETRGTPVPVVPNVMTTNAGAVNAVVAADGTLAYMLGGRAVGVQRTLVWVDRQGQEAPISAPPRQYTYPRLSPDGTRVALYIADQEQDVWIWDLARSTLTRLTFDARADNHNAWTPDGRRVVFSSERAGARNLYVQAADGTGAVERLTESPNLQNMGTVTPDGTRLIFMETMPKTGQDIMQLHLLDAARRVTPLVQTPFSEHNGIVSPDGRWLAYEANNSGQVEVYVRSFPDVNNGTWLVSTGGGTRPLWARDGRELFYMSATGALMRVAVERGPSWAATTPSMVLKEGYFTIPGGNPGRTYDISPDGRRFLMIKPAGAEADAAPPGIVIVENWHEELKRLVPTR